VVVKIKRVEAIPLAATFEQIYGRLDRVPKHLLFPSANFANVGVPRTGQYSTLVRIEADDGLVGWGEAYGLPAPEVSASAIEQVFKPILLGRDPLRTEALWQAMHATGAFHTEGILRQALAGVDIALWDLKGKALGQPISVLLGGPLRERIWCYASPIPLMDPPGAADMAREFLARGFTAIKIKVGRAIADDVAQVGAVREAVGPDLPLMLDVNAAHDAATAIALARAVRPFNCYWLEEPVPPQDLAGLAHVRRMVDLPIATGEQSSSLESFRDLLAAEAADIYMPNVTKAGGISECVRIATLARARNLKLAPHGVGAGIGLAAALQWMAATPNLLLYEYNQLLNPLRHDILVTPPRFAEGHLFVPDGPGLGVEVREEVLEQYRVGARAAERRA
jgi:D-arabinonate dehydratase/D-galactarolactone cycloisomerase